MTERLTDILRTEELPGLSGIITILKVEVTPDLREAKVWFSSLGQDTAAVEKILNRNLYPIQGQLYQGATMRIVPKIRFYADTSTEYAAHISEVFDKLHGPFDSARGHGEKTRIHDQDRA
ncbi:MAG: ribosome-binding factor A [Patescibacteria group bacterium]|nr:ribosome-binding factor A [Patescibacteria group bacterium]